MKNKITLTLDYFEKHIPEVVERLNKHAVEHSKFLHIALYEKYFDCEKTMTPKQIDTIIRMHTI